MNTGKWYSVRPNYWMFFTAGAATMAALLAAWFLCIYRGPQISGLYDYNLSVAQCLHQRNGFALVQPEWIPGSAATMGEAGFDTVDKWWITETRARAIGLLLLWGLTVGFLIRQHYRHKRWHSRLHF